MQLNLNKNKKGNKQLRVLTIMESFVQMFNQSLQTPISYTEVLITNEIYLFQNKKVF